MKTAEELEKERLQVMQERDAAWEKYWSAPVSKRTDAPELSERREALYQQWIYLDARETRLAREKRYALRVLG